MESKTLLEHIARTWPDAVKIDTKTVANYGLIDRHIRLLNLDTGGDIQKELLVFRKKNPDINLLVDVVSTFLTRNSMKVVSPPNRLRVSIRESIRKKAIAIEKTEQFILGLYDESEKTLNGFKQMGETYHLVCYTDLDLIIIYSYSGELQWAPQ